MLNDWAALSGPYESGQISAVFELTAAEAALYQPQQTPLNTARNSGAEFRQIPPVMMTDWRDTPGWRGALVLAECGWFINALKMY